MCEPECPVDAIQADTDPNVAKSELDYWVHINTEYARQWPNITKKKDALPEADEYDPKNYKQSKRDLLSEKPGSGE